MGDVSLLDRVQSEVADIKKDQHIAPDRPVSYEPRAWTREGATD